MSADRAQNSRNAPTVEPWGSEAACALLCIQWSPEQIASKLPISHETVYQHVYANKVQGELLWWTSHGAVDSLGLCVPVPCAKRVCAFLVKNDSISCSWLHLLKVWSLLNSRGDSYGVSR